VNLAFHPRPVPPSCLRNLCALRVGVYPDPLGVFSFSLPRSVSSEPSAPDMLGQSSHCSPLPFDFKLSTVDLLPLTPFPATLTSLSQLAEKPATLSPVYAALSSLVTPKSFACHSYKKHRGWGIPSFAVNSARPALRPTRSSTRIDLINATPRTPTLTPLSATLTKNKGEG
jgi:hypothetical protein